MIGAIAGQLRDFGVGQTWKDVTASRTFNVTYTNTTGKPIIISVCAGNQSSVAFNVLVDNISVAHIQGSGPTTVQRSTHVVIPAGSTYLVNRESTLSNISYWKELRE